jgi:hypothetical protein
VIKKAGFPNSCRVNFKENESSTFGGAKLLSRADSKDKYKSKDSSIRISMSIPEIEGGGGWGGGVLGVTDRYTNRAGTLLYPMMVTGGVPGSKLLE